MYIPRYLEDTVIQAHKTFKVLYVGGPRQVGKTTLLKELSKQYDFDYVTLDDLEMRNLAINEPKLFLEQFTKPLFIDEIQYAPELFSYIKIRVDNNQSNGQYWLTGSQHFTIIRNIQETLAGRVALLSLNTLSYAETHRVVKNKDAFLPVSTKFQEHKERKNVFEFILRGGFPALQSDSTVDLNLYFSSYVQTFIQKDLVTLFGIQNTQRFYNFMKLCSERTGQMLNYADLARDADIAVSTAKDWISILEGTMQIYLLKPYSTNFSKRIIKSPKMYFLDTGLAAYLNGWRNIQDLQSSVYSGRIFETFIISEIVKSYQYRGMEAPLTYFRDKEGHEIDAILEQNNRTYLMEIKSSSSFKDYYLKNIEYVRKRLSNVQHSSVILNTDKNWQRKQWLSVISGMNIN